MPSTAQNRSTLLVADELKIPNPRISYWAIVTSTNTCALETRDAIQMASTGAPNPIGITISVTVRLKPQKSCSIQGFICTWLIPYKSEEPGRKGIISSGRHLVWGV